MAIIARTRVALSAIPVSEKFSPSLRSHKFLQISTCRVSRSTPRALRRAFASSTSSQEKRYTKAHEWIELSPDGKTGTIGVSNYAAKALGDVVYVELPTLDLEVNASDAIGAVESVKSASDIYSPVAGKIIEANSELEAKPGIINKGAEGEGWIARVEIKDGKEVEGLMGADEYGKFTTE